MRHRNRHAIPDLVQEAFTSALAELSTTLFDVRGWFIIQAANHLVHAMARLTPDQRRAIQLRYLDGPPRDATARLMGRSTEAVRCL